MEGRGFAAVFVIIVAHRHVIDVVVHERDQLAVPGCAEPNTLLSTRPVPDRLEHHLAADDQLHRLSELPGRCCGKRNMGPGIELAAEARAQELRNDSHVLSSKAEHLCQHTARVNHSLRRVIQR